jgi:hypothetical protein
MDSIDDLIAKTRFLLEFLPNYSATCSGYGRVIAVKEAIEKLEAAKALAQL